jgi:hypothetical protein
MDIRSGNIVGDHRSRIRGRTQSLDNNPTNTTFGSIIKAGVSAPNSNYPRQAQLGFKLLW